MAKATTPPPSRQQRDRAEPPKQQAQHAAAPPPAAEDRSRPAPADRQSEQAKGATTDFVAWLNSKSDQLGEWCKNSPLTPAALIRFAGITFKREPKFHPPEVWPSIYLALVTAAQLGLEPSGPLGEGWIVPRWDKRLRMTIAQWQTGYRGYISLLIRNGTCTRVRAFCVYDADVFRFRQGSDPGIVHEIFTGSAEDRGDVIGAYAVAWLPSGDHEYEWVPRVDIDKSREMAADNSGAWKDWFDQMARRLPIKRLANQLPVSPRMRQAIAIENAEDQDAIQKVLEGSAAGDHLVRALPAPATPSWPIPSARKDRLKEELHRRKTVAGVAKAIDVPSTERRAAVFGDREDEQMPGWAGEPPPREEEPDPDQRGDPPPPDDVDLSPPADDEREF